MVALPAMLLATVLTSSGETVLYEFTADWCGPCRTMEPTMRRLHDTGYPIQVVDVDRQPELAKRFGIGSIPCFVLVNNGQELDRIEGTCSHDRLVEIFRRAGYGPANSRSPQTNQPAQAAVQFAVAPNPPGTERPFRNAVANSAVPPMDRIQAVAAQPPNPVTQIPRDVAGSRGVPARRILSAESVQQNALQATVRIKVIDDRGHSFATGTVIDVHGDEALVLTCGHVFRESKGRGQIVVDLFVPAATRPIPGELICYEADQRDIGLLSIRPGVAIQPVPVAPVDHRPRRGDAAFSVGCDHGSEPSVRPTTISAVDRYMGPPNLEIVGRPVDGRSGGGLFTADGKLIGVCNSADRQEDRGIYAALRTVHLKLKEVGLEHLCTNEPPKMEAVAQATAPEPDLQPIPQSIPKTTPVMHATTDDTEVICIVRSRSQPQVHSRVIVISRPSNDLIQHLSRESEQTVHPANQVADVPTGAAGSDTEPQFRSARGPILRAQNSR